MRLSQLFHYKYQRSYRKKKNGKVIFFKRKNKIKLNLLNVIFFINKFLKYKYIYQYKYDIFLNLSFFYKRYIKFFDYSEKPLYIKVHTGKKSRPFRLERLGKLKITLAMLGETVTYGKKKEKKKQQKKKKTAKTAKTTKTTKRTTGNKKKKK
jgi:hypothetical protein